MRSDGPDSSHPEQSQHGQNPSPHSLPLPPIFSHRKKERRPRRRCIDPPLILSSFLSLTPLSVADAEASRLGARRQERAPPRAAAAGAPRPALCSGRSCVQLPGELLLRLVPPRRCAALSKQRHLPGPRLPSPAPPTPPPGVSGSRAAADATTLPPPVCFCLTATAAPLIRDIYRDIYAHRCRRRISSAPARRRRWISSAPTCRRRISSAPARRRWISFTLPPPTGIFSCFVQWLLKMEHKAQVWLALEMSTQVVLPTSLATPTPTSEGTPTSQGVDAGTSSQQAGTSSRAGSHRLRVAK